MLNSIVVDHTTVLDFHAVLGPSVAKPGIAAAFNGQGHVYNNFHSRELIAGGSTGSGDSGSRIAGTEADPMGDRAEEMPTRLGPLGLASPPLIKWVNNVAVIRKLGSFLSGGGGGLAHEVGHPKTSKGEKHKAYRQAEG